MERGGGRSAGPRWSPAAGQVGGPTPGGAVRERLFRPAAPADAAGGWPRSAARGRRFVQGLAGAIRAGNLQRSARGCRIWHPNPRAASQAPRVRMASKGCCQKCPRCWSRGSCHCPDSWMGAQAEVPQTGIWKLWAPSREKRMSWCAGSACALLGIPPARDCSRACTFPTSDLPLALGKITLPRTMEDL